MARHKYTKIPLKSEYNAADFISIGNSKSNGKPFILVYSGHQNTVIIYPSYDELSKIVQAIEEVLLRRLLGDE